MARGWVERRVTARADGTEAVAYRARWETGGAGDQRRRGSASFPVPLGAGAKAEAAIRRKAEAHAYAMANGGTEDGARRMTLAELCGRWLGGLGALEPASVANYRRTLEKHVLPELGRVRLRDLDPLTIEAWLRGKEARYARNTVKAMLSPLRAALRQAVAWRLIPFDPAAGVRVAGRPAQAGRALTDAEAKRLLAAMDAHPQRALWRVLLLGGLRIGEALALRWEDVDLAAGALWVRRTVTRGADGRALVRDGTKTHRDRVVPLDGATLAALRDLGRQLPGAAVFPAPQGGGLMAAETPRQWLRSLLAEAGVGRVRLNDLRHSQVTLLRAAGVRPDVAARIAGHSVEVASEFYAHVSEEEMRAAVEGLAARLDG